MRPRTSSKPFLSSPSVSSSSLLPSVSSSSLLSSASASGPGPIQSSTSSSSLETKGAQGELQIIKQSTQLNKFFRDLSIHSLVNRFKHHTTRTSGSSSTLKELDPTSNEFLNSEKQFNLLKFEQNETVGVHYKLLARNMFHLKIFPNIETSQQFLDFLFPQMKYVTFSQVIHASKKTSGYDESIRKILLIYLRELGKENEELPKIAISQKPIQATKLFATTRKGSKGSLRLSLIPRQRQAVVSVENQDIDSKELENLPLRKSVAAEASTHEEHSISIHISRALQGGESGYSYREKGGAKPGSVSVITHKE